jgi:hypothetical protein
MISLGRAAHVIDCRSCHDAAYGIARFALAHHDGTLHFDPQMCEAAPIHAQRIARMRLLPSSRRDIARSPAATTITKSP